MKKLALLTIVFFAIHFAATTAQTQKGNFLMGLSSSLGVFDTQGTSDAVGFTNIRYKSDDPNFEEPTGEKMSSVNFFPSLGYFPVADLAVGLNMGYSSSKNEDGLDESYVQTVYFGGGPFVRYYKQLDKALAFIEVNGSYGTFNTSFQFLGEDENVVIKANSYGGVIGMAIPLSKIVTFDILARYISMTLTEAKDNTDNFRALAKHIGLDFGFTVFLGKKSKDKE